MSLELTSSFGLRAKAIATIGVLAVGLSLGACSAGSGVGTSGGETASSAAAPKEATGEDAVSKAPAPAVVSKAPTVGKPFSVEMGNGNTARITIVSAKRAATVNSALSTQSKNGSFLVLDVLWETEAGSTSSNPLYFMAKDANGRKADLNMFADGQLGSGDVVPGDKSRGLIVFDIAPGAATVIITNPILQEAARIQIPG